MGMIGGGAGSFIGEVHRIAARLDGFTELMCGSFSAHYEETKEMGGKLFLEEDRVYADFREMIKKESQLPSEKRIDFISITTPNHLHYEAAKLALENGFHIVLEKPMAMSSKEAIELNELAKEQHLFLCLTHGYTGYPMVKQAKEMIREGMIGEVRKVYVEYPQGWMSEPIELQGNTHAAWRVDPKKSGIAGGLGDIGTHAFNMVEYVTGIEMKTIFPHINTIVENRALDDDNVVLFRLTNGADGVLTSSQIAAGEENCIKIRVYGEKAGLSWEQDDSNSLEVKWLDRPKQVIRTGGPDNLPLAVYNQRTPAGHPEGFIEAFANLYRNFIFCVSAKLQNEEVKAEWLDFPNGEDGIREMIFIEKSVSGAKKGSGWIEL